MLEINKIHNGNCLELMKDIEDKSINCIICDLPYGTTSLKWDSVIPFDKLWEQYERIIKDDGAIVLTATQPFTSALVMSNPKLFKYELIWNKVLPTGFANAKIQPMKQHESILVFGKGKVIYNPQMIEREKPRTYKRNQDVIRGSENLNGGHDGKERTLTHYYPRSIIEYSNANQKGKIHPTQKPLSLYEYLINTYSNEGDLVLDNCSGSGTLAIASVNTNRNFICIEQDDDYWKKSSERLELHNPNQSLI